MAIAFWLFTVLIRRPPTAYWIAFGPHGPRALPPPDETFKIVSYTAIGIAVAFGIIFAVKQFARPPPSTMNKEWEEQTNEYLKVGGTRIKLSNESMRAFTDDSRYSHNGPSLSRVSLRKAMSALGRCRANRRRSRGLSQWTLSHIIRGMALIFLRVQLGVEGGVEPQECGSQREVRFVSLVL